ncbi:uncharacterized protein LOC132059842 isoform X1 [Lycium ferocissimum]|uniref:uncharacterized protein LOC132059842 isoform X1 n=1 Tax=Lycium ferocissimum TaxID=112874 RepID=UPI0028166B9B|nr:uncharacterized protein LOC132059842 isoform X1 [Lycium ferocissimum]XP_059308627.1 uncharacterized protein LOC132059842 isoform X1 [Lycium ferocissimum]
MARGRGRGRRRPRKVPLTSFGSSVGAQLVVDTPNQSHAAAEVTPIQTEEPSVEDVGPSERRPDLSRKLYMSSIPSKVPNSDLVADPVTEQTNGTVATPVAGITVAAQSNGTVNPSVKGNESQDVDPPEEPWVNLFKKSRVAANGNMPRGKGHKRSLAGRGSIANKARINSQQLENISKTDIPEASTPSSQGDMPRGRRCKRSWESQGGIADSGGQSSQLLQNIPQTDILEPSLPPSQGNMPRGKGRLRSWADQGGIASNSGKSSQQVQNIIQTVIAELSPPLSSQGNMPSGKGGKRSSADQGGIASRGGKSCQQLQNISQTDIREPPPLSSQGNMPWGQGCKRSWAVRGGTASKGGRSSQQLQNIAEADIPEPLPASSQGNMPRGKGRKRSWADRGGIANRGGKSSQQVQNIIQTVIAELSPPSSQGVDSYQCAVSSTGSGFQHSQDVEYQVMPHAAKDVSSQQPALAHQGTTDPQERQHITREIRPLRVNGDTFFPHDAVRDVTVAFKKSFNGSWYSWSKVPELVRDHWFNDFEKKYSFRDADKHLIRKTFDRVGSERLSDTLAKAKKEFAKTWKIPKWINQSHWDGLMQHWNSDDFKRISAINSKNRMSCNNGEGPSLHTGGSVPFAEYRRRHKELTGQELRNEELFLKTHQTKDKEWIDEKSQRVWDMFTKSIKNNVEGTSAPRDENGGEAGAINSGDDETEEANEDNIVNLLQTVSDKQLLNTWIDAVGLPKKKGKIYGLGLETGFRGDPLRVSSASSAAPTPTVTPQQIVETPEFEQILNRVLDQRMGDMQASLQASIQTVMQEEIEVAVRAVMSRMLGFPAPRSNGSGSTSGLP